MRWPMTILLFISFFRGYCQADVIPAKLCNLDEGLAIKGYDPVAYFKEGRAVRGKKEFSLSDHGVNYHFASSADLQLFQANPLKYRPQYGGWCAYAMGHDGSKVEVDPETFKILNGQLFLFYNLSLIHI